MFLQTLAKHVMNIHMNALQMSEEARPGELQLNTLKKYISYCRAYVLRCTGPSINLFYTALH